MTDQDLDFNIKISQDEESKAKMAFNTGATKNVQPNQNIDIESTAPQSRTSTYDLSKANHPVICFLSIAFRVAAILCFLFLNRIIDNSILIFIIVIVISAIDFWMVKNISGRLLVGLRWWNDFKEDGTEVWIFESYDSPERKPNSVDSAFFWTSQILGIGVWGILLFIDVISFQIYWALVSGTAFVLNGVNFAGFYKCRGEHQKKVKELTNQGIQAIGKQIISNAFK